MFLPLPRVGERKLDGPHRSRARTSKQHAARERENNLSQHYITTVHLTKNLRKPKKNLIGLSLEWMISTIIMKAVR